MDLVRQNMANWRRYLEVYMRKTEWDGPVRHFDWIVGHKMPVGYDLLPPPPLAEGGYVEETLSPIEEVTRALDLEEKIRQMEHAREASVEILARMAPDGGEMSAALRAHDATDYGVFGSWFSVLANTSQEEEEDDLGHYSFAPWVVMLRTVANAERNEIEALVSVAANAALFTRAALTEKLRGLAELIESNVERFVVMWRTVTCDAIFKTDVEKVVVQILNDLTQALYHLMHARPAQFYTTEHTTLAREIFESLGQVMNRVYQTCLRCEREME